MLKEKFKEWLIEKGTNKRVVSDLLARIDRVNKNYDLDKYYSDDAKEELIEFFNYSKKDEREGLEPIASIEIEGNYYNGLASLKRAIKQYFAFLDETNLVTLSNKTISGPIFEGSFEDFNRFVGPKLRNVIQNFTRSERNAQNGICEYCGKQAVLQSAHKEGEERPQIIKDVLERSFKVSNDWYKVDLSKFEDYFKDAHTPIKDHIFFLCNECHTKYDKKKTISTLDIENKRVLKFKTN